MMKYAHIVACSKNHVIGRQGQLPWHLPEDLKLFKKLTLSHCVIMGRKTFESIGRPLPKRLSIVISNQDLDLPEGVRLVHSLDEAMQLCESLAPEWGEEAFIIGGGQVYQQSLNLVDRIYMSLVPLEIEGDTFYPVLDPNSFSLVHEESVEAAMPFSFQTYERKSGRR